MTNDTAATHRQKALSHLDAAKAYRLALDDAYASQRQDRSEIADLHQQIGFALKVAEVHALLALVPSSPVRGERQADDEPVPYTLTERHPEVLDLNAERFGRGSRLS